MSLIIIGKLLVGAGTIVAVSVGSIFLHQYLNKEPISISGSYIVVQSGNSESLTPSPFTCQLSEEAESFPCKVEQLKWNVDKKHLDYSSSTYDVPTVLPKESNIVFKITVPKDQYERVKTPGKKTEIIFTKDRQKYTDAKLLFAVDESKKIEGKAEYFVAKAPTPATSLTTLTGEDTYQCAWEKSPANKFKDCEIYDFASTDNGANGYTSLEFQKPENKNKSTSIIKDKHYLIKFTETRDQAENHLNKSQIIFIKKDADANTDSVQFAQIKPSFLIDDKLLILGSQPQ